MPIYFDETISPMESIRFLNRWLDVIHDLRKKTHFNQEEIENLFIIHYKLTRDGPMNFNKFREVTHRVFDITGDELYDKIYSMFDKNRSQCVPVNEWVSTLSTYLRGTADEKVNFAWEVYDMMKEGYVSRDIMCNYMRASIVKAAVGEDVNEVIKDLVDVVMKKLDLDRDGKMSYEDFKTSVENNPLLLEALGQVFPPRQFVNSFQTTFTVNVPKM